MSHWPLAGSRNHQVTVAALAVTPEGSHRVAFHSMGSDPEGVAHYGKYFGSKVMDASLRKVVNSSRKV
jgi:hypothetical protein